jgi:hypothetical protein
MSARFSFSTMSGSKKEKHYANTRAHRHSIVINQTHKKAKKDTDTESISSNASTAITPPPPPPPPKPQCPLRPFMEGMFEPEDAEENKSICPLRRVKLSHTLPLCMFVMVNMILVIGTLLVTGVCRIIISCWDLGTRQPKATEGSNYRSQPNPILFFAVTVFAFIVTACYGPDWLGIAIRVLTTVGFFIGLLLNLLPGKDVTNIMRKVEKAMDTPPESPIGSEAADADS